MFKHVITLLKLFTRFFFAGLWAVALALLLWYPLRWWPGDRLWPVQMLNYFMPWLLVGLLPMLLMAGLARQKRLAAALAIPTLLIGANFAPLFLPRFSVALAGGAPLKVMSYNLLYRNATLDDALNLVRQEQPDILLLQEVTPAIAQALKGLADIYPPGHFHLAYNPQTGQAVISRFPITRQELAFERGRALKVEINTPDSPLKVWNVHPNTPHPWRRQQQQISALVNDIAAERGPLIVGGDFNTTYHSELYRLVDSHLNNAQWEAGWGLGFTFPAHAPRVKKVPVLLPMIRIDHIFYSRHFFAHSARTLTEAGGSDHLPIVAELSLIQ